MIVILPHLQQVVVHISHHQHMVIIHWLIHAQVVEFILIMVFVVPYALNLTMGGQPLGNWYNIWLYGSNSATDFNDISDLNVSGNMILLNTFTYSGNWTPSMGYILSTTSYSFRYYLLLANNYGGYCNITNLSIQHGKMEV